MHHTRDKFRHSVSFCAILLLIGGCREHKSSLDSDSSVYQTDISQMVEVKGTYTWGFERSEIYVCADTYKKCATDIKIDHACWLEFTKAASEQLSKLTGSASRARQEGELWLEGSGRVSRGPARFGHMGGYSCEVELAQVRVVDANPTHALQNAMARKLKAQRSEWRIPPKPEGDKSAWVTMRDYPLLALRNRVQGYVRFRVVVDVNGRVENCTVLSSSGSTSLDDATCDTIMRRARFRPAHDGNNVAQKGSYSGLMRWKLPE
jgi:TonB family protein